MLEFFPDEPKKLEATTSLVPSSHTIYAVLGFLCEYVGRYVSQDGFVERFFPNEKAKAQVFEQYLLRLVDEYKLQMDFRSTVDQGHTYFDSKNLAQLINSFYLKHNLTGVDENGYPAYTKGTGFIREHAGELSMEVFPANDQEAKYAFLIGAFQRYSEKKRNIYRFANAHSKAKLVEQLLKEVGCPNVVFVYSPPDCAPCVFDVAFEPTAELSKRLDLQLAG